MKSAIECPVIARYPFKKGNLDFHFENSIQLSKGLNLADPIVFQWQTSHKDRYSELKLSTSVLSWSVPSDATNLQNKFLQAVLPSLSIDFRITKFQKWLATVPEEFLLLPAPLNAMEGGLRIEIPASDSLLKTALLSLQMQGAEQELVLESKILADFREDDFQKSVLSPKLSLEFNLRKLALKLPRWNLRNAGPKLTLDSRFVDNLSKPAVARKEADKESRKLISQIRTRSPEPITLETNLLDEPLSLNLDLDWDGSDLSRLGVSLLPFKTEFLRRGIELEKFNFLMLRNEGELFSRRYIEGVVHFPLPNYRITARLEGHVENPVVTFSSDPPLPEDDIYSVLVFGQPMDALVGSQQDSVLAARQAMTAGLFSLTSLYFLGSTPVESIYFDPSSGEATASVRLWGASSVQVGGDAEEINKVQLRRSLGKGWYVKGGVSDLDENDENYGASVEKVISY